MAGDVAGQAVIVLISLGRVGLGETLFGMVVQMCLDWNRELAWIFTWELLSFDLYIKLGLGCDKDSEYFVS